MVSAGRVLLMPKGEYNAATTYQLLDIVSYNGSSYIAKGETTGNLPTNTTYWQLSAYGGDAANVSANFATVETTAYASQHYYVGNLLINASSQLCEVTTEILQGDEIILYPETGNNVKLTDVETLLAAVEDSIASVASDLSDVEASIADIEASTTASAAHAIGDKFYLNNVLYEAIAAITIGDTIVLPPDVSATVKVADTVIEQIEAVDTAKQNKTLDTPITIDDVEKTTVEGALGGLNTALSEEATTRATADSNEAITRAKNGAHNIMPFDLTAIKARNIEGTWNGNAYTHNGVTYTFVLNSDGSLAYINANGTPTSESWATTLPNNKNLGLEGTPFIMNGCPSGGGGTSYYMGYRIGNDSGDSEVQSFYDNGNGVEITRETPSNAHVRMFIDVRSAVSNLKFYPMLRLASDPSSDYTPYAMTNRELTALAPLVTAALVGRGELPNYVLNSDTEIMNWDVGMWHVNFADASYQAGYVPYRWGVMIHFKTNGTYNGFIFIGTDGKLYYRMYHSTNKTWYYSWKTLTGT